MNSIEIWSINIVAVSFIACIFRLLLPQSNLKSGVTLGINLLILLVVLSPLKGKGKDFPVWEFNSVEMITFQTENYAREMTAHQIQKNIYRLLSEIGIKEEGVVIDISMNLNAQEQAVVHIKLLPAHGSKVAQVENILAEQLGTSYKVEILTEGG